VIGKSKTFEGPEKQVNIVEKVCIDGYVYINIYQKKPVMTVQYGSSTALTAYPVLQSTTQSFISSHSYFIDTLKPETCINR
jgi:glutamine cyclotransferase